MIESRRLVQRLKHGWKVRGEPPFIGTSTCLERMRGGIVPPRRDGSRDGFENQDACAVICGREQLWEKTQPHVGRKFIEHVRSDYSAPGMESR